MNAARFLTLSPSTHTYAVYGPLPINLRPGGTPGLAAAKSPPVRRGRAAAPPPPSATPHAALVTPAQNHGGAAGVTPTQLDAGAPLAHVTPLAAAGDAQETPAPVGSGTNLNGSDPGEHPVAGPSAAAVGAKAADTVPQTTRKRRSSSAAATGGDMSGKRQQRTAGAAAAGTGHPAFPPGMPYQLFPQMFFNPAAGYPPVMFAMGPGMPAVGGPVPAAAAAAATAPQRQQQQQPEAKAARRPSPALKP